MPDFESAYEEHQAAVNFIVLARAGSPDPSEFIDSNGYQIPFGSDIDGMSTYSVKAIPTTLVFDAGGALVEQRTGRISEEELAGMLAQVL